MRLIQKQGTVIKDRFNTSLEGCRIEAYDLHIDYRRKVTIKVGVFSNSEATEKGTPFKTLTWEFSKDPVERFKPLVDSEGNYVYNEENELQYSTEEFESNHIGSPFIMYTMDVLKPTDDTLIISPKILASQLWVLNQIFDEGRKITDLFEFEDGLLT